MNDKLAARERPGRILSLDEVVQMGKENMVTAEDGFGGKPSRKDLYCIMVSLCACRLGCVLMNPLVHLRIDGKAKGRHVDA